MLDTVLHGDALAILKTLESNSVDSIVTDPPAGISFMGKDWDNFSGKEHKSRQHEKDAAEDTGRWLDGRGTLPYSFSPSAGTTAKERDAFIAFLTSAMAEALRVLKPGGHALVWALPRTSHWTATALEDAGFEVRDCITHLFGSGFPKSLDISKAIDKLRGAEREAVTHDVVIPENLFDPEVRSKVIARQQGARNGNGHNNDYGSFKSAEDGLHDITAPATPEAAQWAGYGTALKPAAEFWWLCRKPLAEKSIAANVLKWGVGAINVDGCRVGTQAYTQEQWNKKEQARTKADGYRWKASTTEVPQGRFPANLVLSHSLWCVPLGVKRVRGGGGAVGTPGTTLPKGIYDLGLKERSLINHRDQDGMEQVEAYDCTPDCPIRILDEQSGIRKSGAHKPHEYHNTSTIYGNGKGTQFKSGMITSPASPASEGGASRYFTCFSYFPKASRSERNMGCEGLHSSTVHRYGAGIGEGLTPDAPVVEKNVHPTVKPLALMRWLIRLITPPDGVVLDCFLGSGSTAVAAIQEGVHFIGIEQSSEYVAICEARIQHAMHNPPAEVQVATKKVRGGGGNVTSGATIPKGINEWGLKERSVTDHRDQDGMEEVEDWLCAEDCPIRIIGEQSGVKKSVRSKRGGVVDSGVSYSQGRKKVDAYDCGYDDTGTAARYFQHFPPDSLFAELEEVAI